jgi:hypothetical protein
MITGIDKKHTTKELKREKLPEYWGQYFSYEYDIELFDLTKNEFIKEIAEQKKKGNPFIDSQIIISRILSNFGDKHIFHRKFNERHSDLHKEQVLGMQLYKILVEDGELWIYHETQHFGHIFPHATYFIMKNGVRATSQTAGTLYTICKKRWKGCERKCY